MSSTILRRSLAALIVAGGMVIAGAQIASADDIVIPTPADPCLLPDGSIIGVGGGPEVPGLSLVNVDGVHLFYYADDGYLIEYIDKTTNETIRDTRYGYWDMTTITEECPAEPVVTPSPEPLVSDSPAATPSPAAAVTAAAPADDSTGVSSAIIAGGVAALLLAAGGVVFGLRRSRRG